MGTIRYFGPTAFAPGDWVGMELERPEGKSNGTIQGISYFTCPARCGLFVKVTTGAVGAESVTIWQL